jgi:protein MpaA
MKILQKILLLLTMTLWTLPTLGQMLVTDLPLRRGFASVPMLNPNSLKERWVNEHTKKAAVKDFCKSLDTYFKKYSWEKDPCGDVDWSVDYLSNHGHGLLYKVFGSGSNTTLILGGVHPDELTPINMAFRFARFLHENNDTYLKSDMKIIVAPLVNPDGFFRDVAVRTNANNVDVNRNFLTIDWYQSAIQKWRQRNGMSRYFPGFFPNSEIETIFQVYLIDELKPSKILSIHAPLGFLDYDGPGDQKTIPSIFERKAKEVVHQVSKKSGNYRVVDYSFYPGSLGNFAGKERSVPTITLELETTSPGKVNEYWSQFLPGLLQSVDYEYLTSEEFTPKASSGLN